MAVRHAPEALVELASLLSKTIGPTMVSQAGRSGILDVTPAGIDNGTGVRRTLAHLGIEFERAIGFGDMPNDLPLFEAVG